mmetsp:Transcript_804/g.1641  ORF Transcript_804/g.1641 Transcript_804/m.1641 type:complete len:185 (-) Transcript_804:693-1247(-)
MVYSWDCVNVVAFSVAGTLLCEFLSWLLIYRKSTYRQLVNSIKRTGTKLEQLKAENAGLENMSKSQKKKEDRLKELLKQDSFDLQKSKMTATVLTSVALLILYSVTSKSFSGKVVAKLPFQAFWPIKGATQRGIETEDLTDCAMTYIYVVCSAGLRPNIQKLLGFTPPRQMSTQNPFEPKQEED